MHGVMRGMFPLQVIRYLRGGGLVERQDGEGEVGRGGVKGRNKATEPHGDIVRLCYFVVNKVGEKKEILVRIYTMQHPQHGAN